MPNLAQKDTLNGVVEEEHGSSMVLHDDGSKNLYICKDPWESLTCEPLSMLGAMAARCQRGEWSTLSKYSPKLLLVVPDALCVDCDDPSANKLL